MLKKRVLCDVVYSKINLYEKRNLMKNYKILIKTCENVNLTDFFVLFFVQQIKLEIKSQNAQVV